MKIYLPVKILPSASSGKLEGLLLEKLFKNNLNNTLEIAQIILKSISEKQIKMIYNVARAVETLHKT